MRALTHITLLLVLVLGGFWAAGNTHTVAVTCPLLGTVSLPLWAVAFLFAAIGAMAVLVPSRVELAWLRLKLKREKRTARKTAELASRNTTPPPSGPTLP